MKTSVIFKRITSNDMGRLLPVPMYASGIDAFNRIGEGKIRQAEIKNPRNLKKHNLLMAKIGLLVDASQGKWKSIDHMLTALKHSLGLYDLTLDFKGNIIPVPRSISFDSMDEQEFTEKFFEPAQPLLEEEAVKLGITVEDLHNPNNWEKYL